MVRRQDYKANNSRFESRVQTLGFPFKQDMFKCSKLTIINNSEKLGNCR